MNVKGILLSGVALLASLGVYAQRAERPVVMTRQGELRGVNESGIKVFKGVPFAQPPVGDLRWVAPQPAKAWTGVREAAEYGPNPMQQNIFGDMAFGTKEMSEDCLYLNIWTPASRMDEKLPVLIYFNGGGLMAGSGSEPRYAGQTMARRGIISITANYREGIFGFFAHPELTRESSYHGSGNYGFMDQTAAIKWVKENIAAFGGDPERITICGESAGSMSVSAQMASPMARGLFARAIGSSGSVLSFNKAVSQKEADEQGAALAKKLGYKHIKDLRALSAEELMAKAAVSSVPSCVIDGHFFTEQPAETFAQGRQARVPLLVGGNSLEMPAAAVLQGRPATVEGLREAVRPRFGEQTDRLLDLYGIHTDADVSGEPGNKLGGDLFIAFGTWNWGYQHVLTGKSPVYRYIYHHARPLMRVAGKVANLAGGTSDAADGQQLPQRAPGAVHSADIEYAMGTLSTNRVYDWQPEDQVMSDIFSGYYLNFVKSGNPNGLGLPSWAPADGTLDSPILHLDVDTYQETDRVAEQRYQIILGLQK